MLMRILYKILYEDPFRGLFEMLHPDIYAETFNWILEIQRVIQTYRCAMISQHIIRTHTYCTIDCRFFSSPSFRTLLLSHSLTP